MVVMAAFNNISGLEGKRNLINACRNVAQKNPQLEITAFDTDSRTADIIENVLPTLFKWSLVILIAVTLIPLITLWNLGACLLSFVGCAYFLGTSYALIGLLGISLDLLSMTSLITVVGIGIRISLYFIGEFLLVWARDNRTTCALHNCGGNVLKVRFL
jgi:predicted exporter